MKLISRTLRKRSDIQAEEARLNAEEMDMYRKIFGDKGKDDKPGNGKPKGSNSKLNLADGRV